MIFFFFFFFFFPPFFQTKLRQQLEAIENDLTLDVNEKATRKQNLVLLHNLNESLNSPVSSLNNPPMSNMSPHAPSFYPPGETVESVVGKFPSFKTMLYFYFYLYIEYDNSDFFFFFFFFFKYIKFLVMKLT